MTLAFIVGCTAALVPVGVAVVDDLRSEVHYRVELQVDFGADVGQNFGSLFEARDGKGDVTAGAGFLGAYNTQFRSNRRKLCFFIKPRGKFPEPKLQRLPRPSADAWVMLFDFNRRLYATAKAGRVDNNLRYWDAVGKRWVVDNRTPQFSTHVADGVLDAASEMVRWNSRQVLKGGARRAVAGGLLLRAGLLVHTALSPRRPDIGARTDYHPVASR